MDTVEVLGPESVGTEAGPFSREDLEILNNNRRLRLSLIKSLAGTDGKVPEEKADKAMLINLINGLDAEVLGRARTKIAAKTEENAQDFRAMVAQTILQHRNRPRPQVTAEALAPPPDIKRPEFVPGQMDVGVVPIKLEDLQDD